LRDEQAIRVRPFCSVDFSSLGFFEASELAFAHAVAIALMRQSELVIMHARRGEREDWSNFPAVRKTLVRWRLLAAGSLPSEVFEKAGCAHHEDELAFGS
jgi:hypothetical protein